MILNSDYRQLCAVQLPYRGRQHYMHTFNLAAPVMASGFEDYAEAVVALCRNAGATEGAAHMTVDEKIVQAGASQRRPKPHVDGVFYPDRLHRDGKTVGDWGGGGGRWNHYCNDIGAGPLRRMPVIVAASVAGCRAWRGTFSGQPAEDGDLSHLPLGDGEVLTPGIGYLLSPDCVHESMIQAAPVRRTFLRIALPVDFAYCSTRQG